MILVLGLLLLSWAVSRSGETWWSLQPVQKPASGETIDGWILQALEAKGLERGVRAEDWILTRRAAFALTGLPPQAVGADPPGDFASEVDRLLASPHFGERWARHWMDVVRFAESKGHE